MAEQTILLPGRMKMECRYIAGSSFGKDSMASILTAIRYKEPLDAVLYCEVMYDENVSGEVPEHRDFKEIFKSASNRKI